MPGGQDLTLLLREREVRELLPMSSAIALVEDALRMGGAGEAENRPRTRIPYPGGLFHYMAAAIPGIGSVGLKAYTSSSSGARFVVLLFDTETGVLLSVIEADWLGRIRTGAASGVASRALARRNPRVAGLIGTGGQAETQLEALVSALRLDTVKVFSRTPERRQAFMERMQPRIEVELVAVDSAEEAVRDSDIVTTITTAGQPVFDGQWLRHGAHVNAAGGNRAGRRELDDSTVLRAHVIAVDSLPQAKIECGDLILTAQENPGVWSRVVELGSVLAGTSTGRTKDDQVTVFESQGVALEDVAVARYVYDRAREQGAGQDVSFGGSD